MILHNISDFEEVKACLRQAIRKYNREQILNLGKLLESFPPYPDEEYFHLISTYRKILYPKNILESTFDGYKIFFYSGDSRQPGPQIIIKHSKSDPHSTIGFSYPEETINETFFFLTKKELILYLYFLQSKKVHFNIFENLSEYYDNPPPIKNHRIYECSYGPYEDFIYEKYYDSIITGEGQYMVYRGSNDDLMLTFSMPEIVGSKYYLYFTDQKINDYILNLYIENFNANIFDLLKSNINNIFLKFSGFLMCSMDISGHGRPTSRPIEFYNGYCGGSEILLEVLLKREFQKLIEDFIRYG